MFRVFHMHPTARKHADVSHVFHILHLRQTHGLQLRLPLHAPVLCLQPVAVVTL